MGWNSADHPPEHVHDQLQRSQSGGPVDALPFELPRAERRFGWGWIALTVILVLLIGSSLALYFSRSPYDSALRQYLIQNRTETALGIKESKAARLLDEPLRKLAPRRHRDRKAALYYLVMHHEQTAEIDSVAAEALRRSPDPRDEAVLEVLRKDRLTPGRAEVLAEKLGEEEMAYQLVGYYAKVKGGLVKDTDSGPDGGAYVGLLAILVLGRILLMLLGGCMLLAYLILRLSGQLSLLGSPAGWLKSADADRYAVRTAQILLVFVGVQIVAGFGGAKSLGEEALLLLIMCGILAFVLFIFPRVPVGGKLLTLDRLGMKSQNLGADLLWGVGAGIAGLSLTFLPFVVMWLFPDLPPPEQPITFELEETNNFFAVMVFFFAAAVAAPIWEEICFRGLMLPAMASVFRSATMGIILSSLCFAAIHTTGIPAWPTLAGVGALGAILTYQRRSLVPAIIMHATYNGIQVVMQVLMF